MKFEHFGVERVFNQGHPLDFNHFFDSSVSNLIELGLVFINRLFGVRIPALNLIQAIRVRNYHRNTFSLSEGPRLKFIFMIFNPLFSHGQNALLLEEMRNSSHN